MPNKSKIKMYCTVVPKETPKSHIMYEFNYITLHRISNQMASANK